MVFSSFDFLLWFLPFCILVYNFAHKQNKNLVLLFFSIVFYAYGAIDTPSYLYLILISVVVNWIVGMMIGRRDKYRKVWLAAGLIWDFGCLFVFKYLDFIIGNLNKIPNIDLPLTNLILPLGISFFTFQIASYLIDVYRGDVKVEYNLVDLGTYILFYPQLIAGPIVRFSDIQTELHHRKVRGKEFTDGLQLFIIGLGRKVLLANQLGNLWDDLIEVGYESISTGSAWMGIIAYSMQLYFDFSGYSQMAIGMGMMFGFHFPQNFRHPYLSVTMTEFWRRWHMTLGTWFKEYVYFPLGGNRKGKRRMYLNMFIVWTLTGLWHGADWNFIFWGMFLFCIMAIEKCGLGKWMDKHRGIGHLYMILLIPLSWMLFAISDLSQMGIFFKKLIGMGGPAALEEQTGEFFSMYGKWLIIGLIFCTAFPENLFKIMQKREKWDGAKYFWIVESAAVISFCIIGRHILPLLFIPVIAGREYLFKTQPPQVRQVLSYFFWVPELLAIFGASCYCIYIGMSDPFLYFRF